MQLQNETIKIEPNGRVFLNLPDKTYKPNRQIGRIEFDNKKFKTYRDPKNQFFKKLGAIGLNLKLLKQGGSYFDTIEIEYGLDNLSVSREVFLEKGKILHFKNNNLDRQIFLSLDLFTKN